MDKLKAKLPNRQGILLCTQVCLGVASCLFLLSAEWQTLAVRRLVITLFCAVTALQIHRDWRSGLLSQSVPQIYQHYRRQARPLTGPNRGFEAIVTLIAAVALLRICFT